MKLVRDLMTIGVPVCRETETCMAVLARLVQQKVAAEALVALDEDGMTCGWVRRDQLSVAGEKLISEIMDEDIPTVSPTLSVEVAAHKMRTHGVSHLFLIHDWPGEPRPSAMISLKQIEAALNQHLLST